MTRPDDWLDAFDPEALDDPDLPRVDEAVRRALDRLEVSAEAVVTGPPGAIPRRPWRRVAGVALAAGVLLGLALARTRPVEPPAPAPSPAPVVEDAPVVVAAPPEVVPEPALGPEPETALEPPPTVARVTPRAMVRVRADGLMAYPGAEYAVADGAAVLSKGVLTFARDDDHDPGVDRVRWADVPVVARPVGTVFTAIAMPGVAALDVSEGRVDLELLDGTPLASLRTGLELTVVIDPDSPTGLRVLYSDHMPLDVVRSMVPPACACRPEDVVAAVAGLRFAGENPLVPPRLEEP